MTAVFEKALQDYRWLYLGFFIVCTISSRMTVSLVPQVTDMTQSYYNVVTAAKPGDIVVVETIMPANWGQAIYMNRYTTIRYWFDKGCVVVCVLGSTSQPYDLLWVKDIFGIPYAENVQDQPYYGKKLVVMPYTFSQGTSAIYLLSTNFRGPAANDLFGNPLSTLPGVANAKTGADIYAYIGSPLGGDYCVALGRVGTNCITTGDSGALCVASTYFGTGLLKGVLLGAKGGMEFDTMLGLGTNTLSFQAGTMFVALSLYVVVSVIVVNIINAYSMQVKKRPLSLRQVS